MADALPGPEPAAAGEPQPAESALPRTAALAAKADDLVRHRARHSAALDRRRPIQSPSSYLHESCAVSALRFFFTVTLDRPDLVSTPRRTQEVCFWGRYNEAIVRNSSEVKRIEAAARFSSR
jgi:hypothetical protein